MFILSTTKRPNQQGALPFGIRSAEVWLHSYFSLGASPSLRVLPVHRLVFRMDEANRSAQIVRFGIFEANLQSGELDKNGTSGSFGGADSDCRPSRVIRMKIVSQCRE